MKKWIVIALIAAVVAVVLFTDVGWQAMSMVVAGVSGVGKLLLGRFGSREEEIRRAHAETREREQRYQQDLAAEVQRHEQAVGELETRLADLDVELADLDTRRAGVSAKIENLSETELVAAGRRYFGS